LGRKRQNSECADVLIVSLLEESNATRVEVAKEQPDLEPKGFRGKEHGWKSAVRDTIQSQDAVHLGRRGRD
jgi:hypothetical protein